MSLYEGMFLMDNRQANRDWDACLEKVKGMVTKYGAKIERCEKWGERRLAYEIKGRRRGTYVLMFFTATGTAVTEIYRECELSDLMLRTLILKADAVPEGPLVAPEDIPLRSRSRSFDDDFDRRPQRSAERAESTPEVEAEAESEEAPAAE